MLGDVQALETYRRSMQSVIWLRMVASGVDCPSDFGNWHTIYMCLNRWTKARILNRMFGELRCSQIVRIKIEVVPLYSKSIKVHPNGLGLQKRATSHWTISKSL